MIFWLSGGTAIAAAVLALEQFGQHVLKMQMGRPLARQFFPALSHFEQLFTLCVGLRSHRRFAAVPRLFCVLF